MQDLYAREYNNLVCLRQKVNEDGIANIADWLGVEALDTIPV